ncbi:MAG: sulfite exporter TauE/SafE family protein, partial [Methylococcales bacterium]
TVPLLLKCQQPIRNAVAISAACGLPIAVAGSIGYIALGWNIPDRPEWSLGYIYGPAFVGIVSSSVLFAPLGAMLAHSLPTGRLKQLFAGFILIVGCKLLLQTWS